jgi:homogentisate 1,2-dioxygenase
MAKNWIPLRQVEGTASRQAHVRLPEGTYEREISKEGFFGPSAQFHHRHKPTDWVEFDGPIRPRAFDLNKLAERHGNPWAAQPVMTTRTCRCASGSSSSRWPSWRRNSDGDQLLFIHEAPGALFCDYGHLDYRDGDYLVIPRGTMWRLAPAKPTLSLMVEATNDHFTLPEKGLVGRHAIFDPAMLDTPQIDDAFRRQQDERTWKVSVKRRNTLSTVTYPVQPARRDRLARRSERRAHQLARHPAADEPSRPSAAVGAHHLHGRPLRRLHFRAAAARERSRGAPLPFFHNNDDFEEVIFYHKGSFFSRDNIHPGMRTVHPSGFTHGPHPQGVRCRDQGAANGGKTETDEVAGHGRHPRRGRCCRHAGRRRVRGLREVVASRGDETGGRVMKLASLKEGGRDGTLIVVDQELKRQWRASGVAPTLQKALDDWANAMPEAARASPEQLARRQGTGLVRARQHGAGRPVAARLPMGRRIGLTSFMSKLVRKARVREMPPSFWTDPLMYQGGSDSFVGCDRRDRAGRRGMGHRLRGRDRGLRPTTCRWAHRPPPARRHIKLVTILNDVSLRNLIVTNSAKGFGFFHGKPATAFAPVA